MWHAAAVSCCCSRTGIQGGRPAGACQHEALRRFTLLSCDVRRPSYAGCGCTHARVSGWCRECRSQRTCPWSTGSRAPAPTAAPPGARPAPPPSGVYTHQLVSLAVMLPRPMQRPWAPACSGAETVPASHGQSCCRANRSTSRCPPTATHSQRGPRVPGVVMLPRPLQRLTGARPVQPDCKLRCVGPEPPTVWHAPRAPVHPGPSQPLGGRAQPRSRSQTATPVGKRGRPEASTAASHGRGRPTCASMVRSKGFDQPLHPPQGTCQARPRAGPAAGSPSAPPRAPATARRRAVRRTRPRGGVAASGHATAAAATAAASSASLASHQQQRCVEIRRPPSGARGGGFSAASRWASATLPSMLTRAPRGARRRSRLGCGGS